MTHAVLLACTLVRTYAGPCALSSASGFFFRHAGQVHLVTCRHVLQDLPAGHLPDRIEIDIHEQPQDLGVIRTLSLPLYRHGRPGWRAGQDRAGPVDVATLAIDPALWNGRDGPACFTVAHLQGTLAEVGVGEPVLIIGFPMGFHDQRHHLPVARQASIASAFGVRFQGLGQFLTDARTHRGSSGSPVVLRDPSGDPRLPWKLLGVHSARLDMLPRDTVQDEALGLNCAWYADVLPGLIESAPFAGVRTEWPWVP